MKLRYQGHDLASTDDPLPLTSQSCVSVCLILAACGHSFW